MAYKIYDNGKYYKPVESCIPTEYQRVEYLESDGNQYIDTGFAFTSKNVKIEQEYIKFNTTATNTFGVDTSSYPRYMHGNIWGNGIYCGYDRTITNVEQVVSIRYNYYVEIKNNKLTAFVNGTKYETTNLYNWNGTSYTDYIFATNKSNGASYIMTGRIYYHRMYMDDILVRYFLPVIRKSDNKPGMYDLISNKFYINKGSGEFTYGSLVNDVILKRREIN